MNLTIAVLVAAVGAATNELGVANVTAAKAYYDHGEGFASFSGGVCVEDPDYQLHADRAYVFTDGTNGLKKIVALGNVAMTNGQRRAYGAKASYYRKSSLVVLSSDERTPAEVRETTPEGERLVRGKKIRFWTTARQVEVEEAWIETPRKGLPKDGLKNALGK